MAIDRALETAPTLALRFCAAVYRWWCARGRFAEAELAFSSSLEACGEREPGLRARVLQGRAYTAIWAGDFEAADLHATEALALADEVGDDGTAARALPPRYRLAVRQPAGGASRARASSRARAGSGR